MCILAILESFLYHFRLHKLRGRWLRVTQFSVDNAFAKIGIKTILPRYIFQGKADFIEVWVQNDNLNFLGKLVQG